MYNFAKTETMLFNTILFGSTHVKGRVYLNVHFNDILFEHVIIIKDIITLSAKLAVGSLLLILEYDEITLRIFF